MSQLAAPPSYSLPPGEPWPRRPSRLRTWARRLGAVVAGAALTVAVLWALGVLPPAESATPGAVPYAVPSASATVTTPVGSPASTAHRSVGTAAPGAPTAPAGAP